jgi:hypothetical protein
MEASGWFDFQPPNLRNFTKDASHVFNTTANFGRASHSFSHPDSQTVKRSSGESQQETQ